MRTLGKYSHFSCTVNLKNPRDASIQFKGLGLRVQGLGLRVQGSGFRV